MLKDFKKIFFFCNIDIVSIGYCSFINICGINIYVCSENYNVRVCEYLWLIILLMCFKIIVCILINIYFYLIIKFKKIGI